MPLQQCRSLRKLEKQSERNSVPVALLTNGSSAANLTAEALQWQVKGHQYGFVLPIRNDGNRHVPLQASMSLADEFGRGFMIESGYGRWLLPGDSDNLSFRFRQVPPPGNYQVEIAVDQGEGQAPLLGRILPVEPTGEIYEAAYRPKVTELGERHPVTATLGGRKANDPPEWGQWFRHVSGDSLRGSIVMSGLDDRPLLVLDRVGEGRVAQFMSDHMWLWSRGFDGGGPQAELLRRISHWLMKEPELEEEDLRASVVDGRLEITRRSLIVDNPDIDVVFPSGKQEKITLEPGEDGIARASLDAEEAGLYRVSDGVLSAVTAAGPLNPREFENALSSAAPLQALLKDSGGTSIRLAKNSTPGLRKVSPSRDQFGRNWIGIKDARGYVVTGVNQVPLLPAILLLLLLVGGAVTAWFREGH